MDKNAIKKYAVWARRELIEKVSQKALQYGIENCVELDSNAESINGVLLSETEKKQRQALINKIKIDGYSQVIEEVAYTWFNRFIALRFMEVNGYLPSHVRIFTNEEGLFAPQIMAEALHLDFKSIDRDLILEMKQNNRDDELFRYLIIAQCNELNSILPGMFQKIEDYTGLLLPDYLLRPGSVVEQMITLIPESDWTDQVQIIGWMYQYYISEPKDERINARKKYVNNDISYVTQLFTSEWIVKFMAQNSLGKLWAENYNSNLANGWEYYLSSQVKEHRNTLTPMDIKCIDPCCGSGHILSYIFDLMVQIYEEYGYSTRDAVPLIVEKNIYGLDIDERAAQLAYFSIMMKARQYDRRFLTKGIQANIFVIPETNSISDFVIDSFCDGDNEVKKELSKVLDNMRDAKTYGSLLKGCNANYEMLSQKLEAAKQKNDLFTDFIQSELVPLVKVSEILSKQYDVVVTNPPYMNSSYMPKALKEYVQDEYGDYKSDLFAAFIVRTITMCKSDGHIGLLTPYVWMSILSYEKLREAIYRDTMITSMVQLEYNAFESACVPVCTFTLQKTRECVSGEYIKLSEFKGSETQGPKTLEAIANPDCGYRFSACQDDFKKIPGAPVAFWVTKNFFDIFTNKKVDDIGEAKKGISTSDNDRFLRYWFEVDYNKLGLGYKSAAEFENDHKKWAPMNKGGIFRKWYGNNDYVVNWEFNGSEVKNYKPACIRNEKFYFGESVTWTDLTSYKPSFRYNPCGFIHDVAGPCIFSLGKNVYYVMGILNSKVIEKVFEITSPTMHFNIGTTADAPIIINDGYFEEIEMLVKENIEISKADWDSFEVSWDFKKHPLIGKASYIGDAYELWEKECTERFDRLKQNEEKLNELVIRIYGLEGELKSEVDDTDVTVRKADRERDIKSLLSYAVGCIFGRYSLNRDGIVYAGGLQEILPDDPLVDRDNIIPIVSDEYFTDDIVGKLIEFVRQAYGEDQLENNLKFIADSLGGKGSSREVIRKYFLNDFYKDHVKVYQKHPIYWLFTSGKKDGFKALMYIHRYHNDTLARVRTDYVHELQSRYRTEIETRSEHSMNLAGSEKVKNDKQLAKLIDQDKELHDYEEVIHHLADQMISINLDDGVKANYELFEQVLEKIR
jgi:type II restriction/modification system DNA methylase subunit YeeA